MLLLFRHVLMAALLWPWCMGEIDTSKTHFLFYLTVFSLSTLNTLGDLNEEYVNNDTLIILIM